MRLDLIDGVTKSGSDEVYVERAQILAMCDLAEPAKDKTTEKQVAAS